MKVLGKVIRDNKGAALIIAMMVIAVTAIIVLSIMLGAVSERKMAKKWADSVRACYAAESGINRAIVALNNYKDDTDAWEGDGWVTSNPDLYTLSLQPLVSSEKKKPEDTINERIAYYKINLIDPGTEAPTAVSTGYSPTINDSRRTIRAPLKRMEAAITAKGAVVLKGNAEVNGEINEFADFSFDSIFRDEIGTVKGDTETEVVTDPVNNYEPVPHPADTYTDVNGNDIYDDGDILIMDYNENGAWDDEKRITWFELSGSSQAMITEDSWSGSSLLIVENGDLKITGGNFNGVIYVMGNLTIAGNAIITGGIFVDGTVDDITNVSGTPSITYDEGEITGVFDFNPMPFVRASWKEEHQHL